MGILYYSFHYPPLLLLRRHPVAELLPGKLPLPREQVLAEGAVGSLGTFPGVLSSGGWDGGTGRCLIR